MTRIESAPFAGLSSDRPRARSMGILALWTAFTLISAFVLAGCSSEPSPMSLPVQPLQPVKGSVVTAEGKPVTEGTVTFVPTKPDSREAAGKIGADGTFALKTGDLGDGAAEGEYKVKIESNLTVPGPKPGTQKPLVPVEYLDEQSSNIVVTVKSGANDLPPFKLVPVPKNAARGGGRVNLRDD